MMLIRHLRHAFIKRLSDIQVGDLVRRKGCRGVGLVESIENGFAVVAWSKDHRDILPLLTLRRVNAGGHDLDKRGDQ